MITGIRKYKENNVSEAFTGECIGLFVENETLVRDQIVVDKMTSAVSVIPFALISSG